MAGANVFHVEFGFNDTELTRSLEDEKYHIAEQLIYANAHTPYLDEGCYQRTALNIVLCGHGEEPRKVKTRNLYIAKLLVQCGASPNFRVPESDFGIYLNPGKTPLELVVELYNCLTGGIPELSDVKENWPRYYGPVIGLDNVTIADYDDLVEQLCSLVFIFLSHGGDANVQDIMHRTVLHRTVVASSNIAMTEVLCENGADLNAMDRQGNTPVMSVIKDFNSRIREQVITYLLSRPDIEINHRNKLGRSALFLALLCGDKKTAERLLTVNCDVQGPGRVWQGVNTRVAISRDISALFAAMCSEGAGYYLYDNFCSGENMSPFFFTTSLVDSGYFSCESVQEELKNFLKNDFPELLHLTRYLPSLVDLMFGASVTTLRQLAARKIFTCWVQKHFKTNTVVLSPPKPTKYEGNDCGVKITYFGDIASEIISAVSVQDKVTTLPNEATAMWHSEHRKLENIVEEPEEDCDDSDSDGSWDSNCSDLIRPLQVQKLQQLDISLDKIEEFVTTQSLPMDSLMCFEIELFRLKLFLLLQKCSTSKHQGNECDSDDNWCTDDSNISEENESDLEYW